ncbi:MAG: nitroreductase [Chloroflexi bacterium]|nr:nitroreductase [Chloroflexota bacterium]
MDLIDAIKTRKSIRAFKPDPVPGEVLRDLLEIAVRAPSWANSQPWEFAVLGGGVVEQVRKAILQKAAAGAAPYSDIPWPEFPSPWLDRIKNNGRRLFEVLGIRRDDVEKRRWWSLQGPGLFGAPNAIIFYLDRSLTAWSLFDLGLLAQNVMLAAQHYGLGTCAQAALVRYPDVLRRILNIPDSKKIVVGISIGYPDWDAVPNTHQSDREPLDVLVRWHGFE